MPPAKTKTDRKAPPTARKTRKKDSCLDSFVSSSGEGTKDVDDTDTTEPVITPATHIVREVYNPFIRPPPSQGGCDNDNDTEANNEDNNLGHPHHQQQQENVILRLNVKKTQSPDQFSGMLMKGHGLVAPIEQHHMSSFESSEHHNSRRPLAFNECVHDGFDNVNVNYNSLKRQALNDMNSSLAPPEQHMNDALTSASASVGGGPSPVATAPSHFRKMRLLMEFEEKSRANDWPTNTSVHCYWCCHKFNSQPFGIPIKHTRDKFQVSGCFCSLECATAYNFHGDNSSSFEETWARYGLINMLASQIDYFKKGQDDEGEVARGCIVKQAPHRLSLSIFGGGMSIEEFRSESMRQRLTLLHTPPMVAFTQQVEEIADNDMCSVHRYIPVDTERIDRCHEHAKLKRSKPLTGTRNTLFHKMKINITN